jgi:peptidoglycan/xylan/chitin deacetylase (PgdA/CDA1 family)
MRRHIHIRFPEGRRKALTFSYDDNVFQNERFIQILDAHGMKGTFNLNSGLFTSEPRSGSSTMAVEEIEKLFANGRHEVAVHSSTHPFLEQLPPSMITYEVLQDRVDLEKRFHRIVRGMAYPMGTYSDEVVECLKACGIAYARTTEVTGKFNLPKDWLRMPATAKHTNPNLMQLAEKFLKSTDYRAELFYLWGHTYEFDNDNNWNVIEEFVEYMAGHEDTIWYATNIEIYEYVEDFRKLIWSADGSMVQNPTNRTLWFFLNKEIYSIKAGELLVLE